MNRNRPITESELQIVKAGYSTIRTRVGILTRCLNKKSNAYADYGGRGITICAGWKSDPDSFLRDVGLKPGPKFSLERVDNEKGYWCGHCNECIRLGRKANCRWATMMEQTNNRRSSHFITLRGQTKTIAQWARELGVSRGMLDARVGYGWSDIDILTAARHSAKLVGLGGRLQKVDQWAEEANMSQSALRHRLDRGMPLSLALQKPVTQKDRLYHLNGEIKTLRQWADSTGIPYQTIYARLRNGWSIARSLGQ